MTANVKLTRRGAVGFLAGATGGALIASPPAPAATPHPVGEAVIDKLVVEAMRAFEVPGVAVGITSGSAPRFLRGYGVRRLGSGARVDEATLFPVASMSKSFTAASIAILVDEGKLSWDDKVIDRLPGFQMHDPYVSRELTVLDLFLHRSGLGLGAGDLMHLAYPALSAEAVMARLRWLPPSHGFRSKFAYDNILYVIAGLLIARLSGQSWSGFVKSRLLAPLDMVDSTAGEGARSHSNRIAPHTRLGGPVRGMGRVQALSDPIEDTPSVKGSPPLGADGITSNARDMLKWLRMHLSNGMLPHGGNLLNGRQAMRLWTPEILIGELPSITRETSPNFLAYAPGWFVQDFRGERLIWHSGLVEGVSTIMAALPSKDLGIVILSNSEESRMTRALLYALLDGHFPGPSPDRIAAATEQWQQEDAEASKLLQSQKQVAHDVRKRPPMPLDSYVGRYRDRWFGDMVVARRGAEGLSVKLGDSERLAGPLEFWSGDTFRTRFPSPTTEDAFVTFRSDADGSIVEARLRAVSPLADFSWNYHDLRLVAVDSSQESI